MRSIMLSALVAVGLAITADNRAQAQIVISPTVSGSPFVYSSYYAPYSSYYAPYSSLYTPYNYSYAWANPYYNTYQSYWGGPAGNYNWTWVTPSYNYSPYRTGLGWGTYRARYWGW